MRCSPRSGPFSSDAREQRLPRAAALADDRAAHSERLDRPEDRRRQAGRGHVPRAPGAARRGATNPDHLHMLEQWMRSYRPEELFDDDGRLRRRARRAGAQGRAAHGRESARQWRPAAEGPAHCRTSATMPSRCRRRAPSRPKRRACSGRFLRDVMRLNAESRNFRVMGPDETASNRLDALFEVTDRDVDRADPAVGRPPVARRPRDGGAQRAHVPGLAGRLSADRPARLLLVLRGVHPHHRFDVQPACQVAEDDTRDSLAPADRLVELPADLATSGGRTTTASATRIPASSTTW